MKKPWLSSRGKWGAASALAAVLFAFSGNVSAQLTGIAATRHNLGGSTDAGTIVDRNRVTGGATAEICVFCHTPHGADTSAPAPLWNKRLGVAGKPAGGSGSYTTYATLQTPSLDGTIAEVGSVSMACLSCHDGTQAMDNIINAPGSGGFDATGGGDIGRTGATWSWAGSPRASDEGVMANGGGFISMLGTDLSNDHPIGIQYCGGAVGGGGLTAAPGGTDVAGTCKDGDFVRPNTSVINSNQIFWIDTGADGKQRTDLPLYNRAAVAGQASLGPLVECASCHDPHVSEGQAGPANTNRVAGKTFLRISNDGSAVCTACHVK